MQILMLILTKVEFHFKCFLQSDLTVYYGCAHLDFSSHMSWCYLEGLKTT